MTKQNVVNSGQISDLRTTRGEKETNTIYENFPNLYALETTLGTSGKAAETVKQLYEVLINTREVLYNKVEETAKDLKEYFESLGLPKEEKVLASTELAKIISGYVMQNEHELGIKNRAIEVNPDTLSVRVVGADGFKEQLKNTGVGAIVLLATSGYDISKIELPQINEVGIRCKEYVKAVSKPIYELDNIERAFRQATEQIYLPIFAEKFDSLAETAANQKTAESFEQLENILEKFGECFTCYEPRNNQAAKIYSSFELLRNVATELSTEQRKEYLNHMLPNMEVIYKICEKPITEDLKIKEAQSWEDVHRLLAGLTHEDVTTIREANWQNVRHYIEALKNQNTNELTIDILRDIHSLSGRYLFPSFALGFRFDPNQNRSSYSEGTKDAIIADGKINFNAPNPAEAREEMENIVQAANTLISEHQPKIIFEIKIAPLAAEYVVTHPHPDGNGTMALFFVEACMALRGDYELLEQYDMSLYKRTAAIFRGNPVAEIILKLEYGKRVKKLKREE